MGPSPERSSAASTERMVEFFESQLKRLGLGKEQVAVQTLPQLQRSLRDISDLISHPQSLGSYKFSGTVKLWVLESGEASAEISGLPILLERRNQIEVRIEQLEAEGKVEEIKEKIGATPDVDARKELEAALQEAQEELITMKSEAAQKQAEVEEARLRQAAEEAKTRDMQARAEVAARKAEIYQSWLVRESMASLIGAVLVLIIGVALVAAMFTHTPIMDILGNAFLLVLGYFFGQSSVRRQDKEEKAGTSPTKA